MLNNLKHPRMDLADLSPMLSYDTEIRDLMGSASRHFQVVTEKAVSDFVCRHMKCEPATCRSEAEEIVRRATAEGFEFLIVDAPVVDARFIGVRNIGDEEFFDRARLPTFREVILSK